MKSKVILLLTAILLATGCEDNYTPPPPAPAPPPLPPVEETPDNGEEGTGGTEEPKVEIPFKDVIIYPEFKEDFNEATSFLRFAAKANGGEDFRYFSAHPSLSEKNNSTKIMMMRIDPADNEGWGKGPQVITKDYTFYGSYATRLRVPDTKKAQKNLGAAAGLYVYDIDEKYGHSEIGIELRLADPTKVYLYAITGEEGKLNTISRTVDLAAGSIKDCSYSANGGTSTALTDAQNAPSTIKSISGFDASKKLYIYGFDWSAEKITWWLRESDSAEKVILWEYEGKELFPGTYAPMGIPVLPAQNATSFWHSTSRLAHGLSSAKEAPKYPYEMEIDWMSYTPFQDAIDAWKEEAKK